MKTLDSTQTTNTIVMFRSTQQAGAKFRQQEDKNPDSQIRSLINVQWKRKFHFSDT